MCKAWGGNIGAVFWIAPGLGLLIVSIVGPCVDPRPDPRRLGPRVRSPHGSEPDPGRRASALAEWHDGASAAREDRRSRGTPLSSASTRPDPAIEVTIDVTLGSELFDEPGVRVEGTLSLGG
jgi:hypothetical protein